MARHPKARAALLRPCLLSCRTPVVRRLPNAKCVCAVIINTACDESSKMLGQRPRIVSAGGEWEWEGV